MNKLKIRLTTCDPKWPWLRQVPREYEERFEFLVDGVAGSDVSKNCDLWVVYEDLVPFVDFSTSKCREVVLFTGEPYAIKSYSKRFLSQFDQVFTSNECLQARSIRTHTALPWHYGVDRISGKFLSHDEIKAEVFPVKRNAVSLICSSKSSTKLHRQRLRLASELTKQLVDCFALFGRGIREIADKRDAIYPYKYHIVIENALEKDYWSEKLADAFLGGALPIYAGCQNVAKYFDEASFIGVDPFDIPATITRVREVVESDEYEKRTAAIAEAKRKILFEYNLFSILADLAMRGKDMSIRERIILSQNKTTMWIASLGGKLCRKFSQVAW